MERKQKRKIARQMASLELQYQKTTNNEDKTQIEKEMSHLVAEIINGFIDGTFDLATIDYIDNYIDNYICKKSKI